MYVPANQAQEGFIILQRPSFDLSSACIVLHSLLLLQKPKYVHSGVFVGDGKMITATLMHGVSMQDAGAADNIAVPYAWKDWPKAKAWLLAQEGKTYDVFAWALCAAQPIDDLLGIPRMRPKGAFICSSLVGTAIYNDGSVVPSYLAQRCCTPNDLGRFLGV